MAILKALKYKIAQSAEIAKKKQTVEIIFFYKSALNKLNTCHYKHCLCILRR